MAVVRAAPGAPGRHRGAPGVVGGVAADTGAFARLLREVEADAGEAPSAAAAAAAAARGRAPAAVPPVARPAVGRLPLYPAPLLASVKLIEWLGPGLVSAAVSEDPDRLVSPTRGGPAAAAAAAAVAAIAAAIPPRVRARIRVLLSRVGASFGICISECRLSWRARLARWSWR